MKKRLHVLILPEFLPFNEKGWGGFTWNYIKSISPYCKVTIFHSRINGIEQGVNKHTIDNNVQLVQFFPHSKKPSRIKKPTAYLKWFKACFRMLKDIEQIDVIHAHGVLLNGNLARKLAKEWGIPYVITEHTGPFSKVVNSSLKRILVKKIMKNADAVLAVSKHLKNEIIANKIQPKRIEVTYNPVDTELFQLKENKLFKNIVFAGRMDKNKGGLRAVKAFHIFYKTNTDWKLTLCGDGKEMNEIQEYVKRNNLKASIKIKGMQKEEEVATAFQQADIFISPTQHESFGLAIAEAMSCGLPVITTNKTAPPEYVNASSGILLDVNNIEDMANSLSTMVKNINQYNASRIREHIVNQFSVSNFGQSLLSIYKSL